MKSSKAGQTATVAASPKGDGYLSNGPLYSLLAIYMPLGVLAALVFLLREHYPIRIIALLASGTLSAFAASFYCDFMKDVKSSRSAADFRGIIVILLVAYIVSSLSRWDIQPLGRRFMPDLSTILALFGTFFVWMSVISLKHLFSIRKRFEVFTEVYQGEQLHSALFEESFLLHSIDQEIITAKRNYLIQLILITAFLILTVILKDFLPPALYLLLTGLLASAICIFGLFRIMRQEHYCAAKGMALSASDRSKHIFGIGIFSVLSIVAGILLSSEKSILSFSLVVTFFGWIFTVITWFIKLIIRFFMLLWRLLFGWIKGSPQTEPEIVPEPAAPIFPFLDRVESNEPSPIWTWLKYSALVLAAIAFLWFLISPLIRRAMVPVGKLTFFQRLRRIIAEWFRGILKGFVSFFTSFRKGNVLRRLRQPDSDEIQRMSGAILGAYSQAKKREIDQSVTLFARLIIWGGEIWQVMWKPVHAPGEYCCLLVASIKTKLQGKEKSPEEQEPADSWSLSEAGQLAEAVIYCGELFEKALYSAEVLSDAERKEFKDMVEMVTSKGF
jgi:hypothetical protein